MRTKLRSGGRFAAKAPFWRPLCGQNSVLASFLRPKLHSGGRFAVKTPFWRPFCGQNSVLPAALRPKLRPGGRFGPAGSPWIGGSPVFCGVFVPSVIQNSTLVLFCCQNTIQVAVLRPKHNSGGRFATTTPFWWPFGSQNSALVAVLGPPEAPG